VPRLDSHFDHFSSVLAQKEAAKDLFKGRHFDQEIIVLCVRWYLTFKLKLP
jgi:hypothetical protein